MTEPFRTIHPADPAILAQFPLSRRSGDRDERCECLRRLALRPRDPISGEQRAMLRDLLGEAIVSEHWSEESGEVRPGRSEFNAVQVAEAAMAAREQLFDALDAARPPHEGPTMRPSSSRAVLTGTESHIDPDPIIRQTFGESVKLPGNFNAARRQLGGEAA